MKKSIYPCITLKGKAEEAADFYISTFGEGLILQKSPFVTQIQLSGETFMLLNDGPTSAPNPSISFMVFAGSAEETTTYFNKIAPEGKVMMPLDSYAWSSNYAWVEDKYGVSWQLYTGEAADRRQKFSPTLMFTGAQAGSALSAMEYYTRLFPDGRIEGVLNYSKTDGEDPDFVKHAQFNLIDFTLMAMDSSFSHGFQFNDAISFVVECDTQHEIDAYWNALTADGGVALACGWLTDKYGLSWQIVPKILGALMKDPGRGQRVMAALMNMKKLVIADLENA